MNPRSARSPRRIAFLILAGLFLYSTSARSDQGDREAAITLEKSSLSETIEAYASKGLSGVVYVRIDGEVLFQAAYGMANESLGVPNSFDTIFGVGSRPIDFTVAAIYLLEQEGKIDLDHDIGHYFDDVPGDKRNITLRHLLTGQSGLPDFHGVREDWDQDLAWIDRATAESRILGQKLLFEPGKGDSHSHSAFGLLASVIERVSGQTYYAFIRAHFLDPAGMDRTGEYGEARDHKLSDFAEGGGPSRVGLPNIPPNWGPTSWLVKGSGGMYSTVSDLLRFYDYVRTGDVLDPEYRTNFTEFSASLDGSDRGFELFSVYDESGSDEAYLLVNRQGQSETFRALSRALLQFVSDN